MAAGPINAGPAVSTDQLWIYPQLVGPSDVSDLLYRPGTEATFDLVDSRVLSNGIVLATYAP